MAKTGRKTEPARPDPAARLETILFWLCVSLLVLVPLAFSTAAHRTYQLPKVAILLVGSAAILLSLVLIAGSAPARLRALRSNHAVIVALYLAATAASTLFGASPLASLFGSYGRQMGLLTQTCFFIVFAGLAVAVKGDGRRLNSLLWSMAITGLLVALYGFAQFFGQDPFLPAARGSPERATSTLGHSNYLGHFLLYTTPLTLGLALASRGSARRIALSAVGFSIAAITFSGTRGAWLGAVAGLAAFALLEWQPARKRLRLAGRREIMTAAAASVIILVVILSITYGPGSRGIMARARSFITDRFTGSGRVILWRDAIKMVPAFALTGCGPEAFSREFLAYKSVELARYAPQVNNESPHNAFLDSAISTGLAGAALYTAAIASAFALLMRARRRATARATRLAITGIESSLVAVVVHNLFIYDEIATGLYFFAFLALAPVALNLVAAQEAKAERQSEEKAAKRVVTRSNSLPGRRAAVIATGGVAFIIFIAACLYATSLARADVAMRRAFESARANDFTGVVTNGERAASSLEPTGSYNFLFARALAVYADGISQNAMGGNQPGSERQDLTALRSKAIALATEQARKSLAHSLTPESNYVLLGYLALSAKDTEQLSAFATEAIRWDPNYYNAHWLMAEALLARGDSEAAEREARIALRLRPGSREALSILSRIRGETGFPDTRTQGSVERARIIESKGKVEKAERLLNNAVRDARGPCPGCHRALALLYERASRFREAIAEWEAVAREAPGSAADEEVSRRIESLKQK